MKDKQTKATRKELIEALRGLLEYTDALSSQGDNVERRAARIALAKATRPAGCVETQATRDSVTGKWTSV